MSNVNIEVLRNTLLQYCDCEVLGFGYWEDKDEFVWTAALADVSNPVETIMKEHGLWEHDGVYEYDKSKLEVLQKISTQYWDDLQDDDKMDELREKFGVLMDDGTHYHSDSVADDNLAAFQVVDMLQEYVKIKQGEEDVKGS